MNHLLRKLWPHDEGQDIAEYAPVPARATEFELRVSQLRLTTEKYASSPALRAWCEHNKNRYYVPEWLLAKWSMSVDPSVAA